MDRRNATWQPVVGVWLIASLWSLACGPGLLGALAPRAAAADVIYVHDDAGRLRSVFDAAGNSATYRYDAVGNLTGILRGNSGGPSITALSPTTGAFGAAVTISGTGFASTAADNVVTFNGIRAVLSSATATKLVTRVPVGATTGPVTVTTPGGSAHSTGSFAVTVPDLVPIGLTAPSTAGTSQMMSVSWKVTNQGTGLANGSWSDNLYLSTDPICCTNDVLIGSVPASLVVGVGASYTKTQSLPVPKIPPGSYHLILKVDAAGSLPEAAEDNNLRVVPITITVPDLTPTALNAPSSATSGQALSISWTALNQGPSAAAPSWRDALYLARAAVCCDDALYLTGVFRNVAVNGGASYSQTVTFPMPVVAAGDYFLFLALDDLGNLYERDETNNRRMVPIRITRPELVPTALSAPASATTQQSITVSWTVQNQGDGSAAPSWSDAIYLSSDPFCCETVAGDLLLASATRTTTLAAGASYSQTKTVTVPSVPAGNYYLFAQLDTGNSVAEPDETNDLRMLPIAITTPDLAPTSASAPASSKAQQALFVTWTVTNQGTGPAKSPWTDSIYLSADQACCAGATLLGNTSHTVALAAGAQYTQTQRVILPARPPGSYYVIVKVDAAGTVYEADETNNQRAVPLTITP